MSRCVSLVKKNVFSVVVSIPRNAPDMAKAAEAGGADAIKVHLNCKHPASGFRFGSFSEERKKLEKIVTNIQIPVGVVPGAEKRASLTELSELFELGFDFFDIFAHDMPIDYLHSKLGRMVCINDHYSPSEVKCLESFGAQVFEASIIPHSEYGKPVVFSDLVHWKLLIEKLSLPVLISTQRKIEPHECEFLLKTGARGIVIGIIVTGATAKGVEKVTSSFRQTIDKMKLNVDIK